MELNKKCLDIMAFLRQEEDYVTIERLSEKYGVSVRGIRYNLDKIESYMVSHGLPYLDRERRLGVRLPPDEAVYRFVDSCAGQLVPFQYSYAAEERQTLLRVALLLSAEPIRIDDFCHLLERSRNTVFKDLEQVETWLRENGMTLVKRPRLGMYAEGPEAARRELLTELLMEGVPSEDLLRYMAGQETRSKAAYLLLDYLLSPAEVGEVNDAVKRIEGLLERQFSDETFANLILRLAVTLRRGGAGRLELSGGSYLPMGPEYSAAKVVLDELEHRSGINIPENEIVYFTCNLLGAKVLKPELRDIPEDEREALSQVSAQMVGQIEEIYQVNFGELREDTVKGVLLHLYPAVHRIRYGLYNKNPLYNEVVTNYNALFINTRIVCQCLEEYVGRPVSDHEVSYIALHFGAALHRINKRTSNRARVLLVCGTGLGSAKMISSQIEKLFNVDVVDTVSGRTATEMSKRGVDYIITTVPLNEEENGPRCIRVSPMFTEKDQEIVGQYLTVRYTPKERYDLEVTTANRLLDIVEKYCVVTDRLHLQYELLSELMNHNRLNLERRTGEYRLCDLLTRDRVAVGLTCAGWRESVALSTRALENEGLVTPDYQTAIVRSLEEYGPYMVMLPGIALAHARPEDGVVALGMSMVVLETPVEFGYAEHDPVKVVVALAAEDDKKHLKALAQLFQMFKDEKSLNIVMEGTREDILGQVILHSR